MAKSDKTIEKGVTITDESDRTLKVRVTPGGTTGTKTTVTGSQTVDRTVTLPDADDTLATQTEVNAKADKDLSNLTATSINQDLIPNGTLDLGSSSAPWTLAYTESLGINNGATTELIIDKNNTTPNGTVVGARMIMNTNDNLGISSQTGSGATGDVIVETGNSSANDSGDITLQTGTASGTRGDINLNALTVRVPGTTTSTTKDTGALVIEGGVGIEENLNVGGNATIVGDLTVQGTTTSLDTTNTEIVDQNVLLNKGDTTGATANGSGLSIERGSAGADGSLVWDETNDRFSMGLVGSEIDIVDLSSTQTLSNKSISGYANDTLSNLTSPTSVSQDLIPNGSKNLGVTGTRWGIGFFGTGLLIGATGDGGRITNTITTPSGASSFGLDSVEDQRNVSVTSYTSGITGADSTGSIYVETGNKTSASASGNTGTINLKSGDAAGSGDSGGVVVETGSINTGTRGKLKFLDGSESGAGAGAVWTQAAADGIGGWAAIPSDSGKADTDLGNIASTALSADLLPDVTGTRQVGSFNFPFNNMTVDSSFGISNGSVDLLKLKANTDLPAYLTSGGTAADFKLGLESNVDGSLEISTARTSSSIPDATDTVFVGSGATSHVSNTADTGNVEIHTGAKGASASGASGKIIAETGDVLGSCDSGDIEVTTGSVSSGTRGNIKLDAAQVEIVDSGASLSITKEARLSETLTDNTTAGVLFTYPHATYTGFCVEYTIREITAGNTRTGRLMIASDTSTAVVADQYAETADPGVTWTAGINGANIELKYTTTNTSNNRTMHAMVTLMPV